MKERIYTEQFIDAEVFSIRCNLCEQDMLFINMSATKEGIEEAKREHN